MAEPDDPSLNPAKPRLDSPDAQAAPGGKPLTDSIIGAMLGASPRDSTSGSGRWQPPPPEELQQSFARYDILEIAGKGGMGAVYKGWQRSLERCVAIKLLPPEIMADDPGFAERFKREAKAMARLSHPGIVAVHDAGTTPGGLLYFIMDFIQGTDVQQMMEARGALPPEDARAIAMHVCDALAYAHRHGVIHRDIKPANVMVDGEGQVKVADFGLAKLSTEESAMLTGSHVTMGTPAFMAPEAMGGAGHVDHRADLYAVGVMLYQMLTGQVPRGRFDPPSTLVAGLDPRFDAIVDRAMQNDPNKRYPSAIDLRADLDRIAAPPISQATPDSSAPTPAASTARRSKMPLWIALAVTAALGLGGFLHLWQKQSKPVVTNTASSASAQHSERPPAISASPNPASVPAMSDSAGGPGSIPYILTSPDYEWSEPANLGPNVNTVKDEHVATLSDDGLILVFSSMRSGKGDLFECRRQSVSQPFGEAEPIRSLNTTEWDTGPFLTGDGLTLLYH